MKKTLLTLTILALLAATLSLHAGVTRTSNPAVATGDNNCTGADGSGGPTDTIAFTETSASISDVNVRVAIDHSWRPDLQFHVTYTGGGGTVILAADAGLTTEDDFYATFDDQATGGACATCGTACSMTAAPGATCTPSGTLANFNGLTSPGTWTIQVCDDSAALAGTLQSWAVTANGQPGDQLPVELLTFEVE